MALCVVAVKGSSLLRLTGSSTIVLWRTGSTSDERSGPGQHRQRINTRGPGEGDISAQTWVRDTSSGVTVTQAPALTQISDPIELLLRNSLAN